MNLVQIRWAMAAGALTAIVLVGSLSSQTVPPPVYVEAFRNGPGKVEETNLEMSLDMKNPTYERRIKDSEGKERYKLSLVPMTVGQDDDRILAWQVSIRDLRRPVFGELLRISQNPDLNVGRAAQAARLDANPYAQIPLMATRIIKLDQFYCVLHVQKYHLLIPERAYMDSMSLEVKLTNSNPLAASEKN